jgi:hypothetical protein
MILNEWAMVSSWGFSWLSALEWMVSLPALFAVCGLLVCPFFLFSSSRRRAALIGFLASLAFFASFILGAVVSRQIRHDAFVCLAERSVSLVAAIKSYEAKHGRPPESLTALTPEFLAEIPKTGMGAYPQYEYVVGEKAKRFDGNPWALYVFTPSGGINFDRFLYFPLQNYPKHGYGGSLQRIGDWAYVHE